MWDGFVLGGAPLVYDVCMSWIWVCVLPLGLWDFGPQFLQLSGHSSVLTHIFGIPSPTWLPYTFHSGFGYAEYFHHSRVELEQRSRNEQLTPPPPTRSSLSHTPFPFHPTVSPLHHPLQRRFLLPCNRNPLVQPFFSPWVSCLCLQAWLGHLAATSLRWPPAREGRGGMGDKSRRDERRSSYETLSHYCMFPFHCSVWSFMLNTHGTTLWCGGHCWFCTKQSVLSILKGFHE